MFFFFFKWVLKFVLFRAMAKSSFSLKTKQKEVPLNHNVVKSLWRKKVTSQSSLAKRMSGSQIGDHGNIARGLWIPNIQPALWIHWIKTSGILHYCILIYVSAVLIARLHSYFQKVIWKWNHSNSVLYFFLIYM